MSTATSSTVPFTTRTSFDWAARPRWKCSPRSTPNFDFDSLSWHEPHGSHGGVEARLIVALEEVAPIVAEHVRLDDYDAFYFCFNDFHLLSKLTNRPCEAVLLFQLFQKILSVGILRHRLRELAQLLGRDPSLTEGDVLQTGDFQPLPFLDHLHEDRRFGQRVVRPRVEPAKPCDKVCTFSSPACRNS